MKLYIVVDEDAYKEHKGIMFASIAHASMIAFMTWERSSPWADTSYRTTQNDDTWKDWLTNSFKKVIVTANKGDLALLADLYPICLPITESSLDGRHMCTVFHPMWSNAHTLNRLKLIK